MARPHRELVHAREIDPEPLRDGWPEGPAVRVLAGDADTGAVDALVSLPAGYRRPAGHMPAATELFVVSGAVRIGDEVRERGYYAWHPGAAHQEAWVCGQGAEILVMARTGPPAFVPEQGVAGSGFDLDTSRMEWAVTTIPGPPPGAFLKVLRHEEATGEALFLLGVVPQWDYPRIEYHDVVETGFALAGDIWLGNSGTMTGEAGSYFWRPPYITHGPFYSREGFVALVYGDGPIVNHYVDDPRRTVAENRAEALALGPPADYITGPAAGG
jgi:hypothetical protein